MNTDKDTKNMNRSKEDVSSTSNQDIKGKGREDTARTPNSGDVTNTGDTVRDMTDTGDVARASISKRIGSSEDVAATDIIKGEKGIEESVTQGVIQYNTFSEKGNKKEIKQDPPGYTADNKNISKVVTAGTSLEPEAIDKANIHSDDGTRHIERAQEKPTKKVEDRETGSWKIKEKDE